MNKEIFKRKIYGVTVGEISAFLGFYLFFAVSYYVTLWFNRAGFKDPNDPLLSLASFIDDAGLAYMVHLLYTAPVWILLFRILNKWSLTSKVFLHCILLPVYVLIWQNTYYFICDLLDMGHLQGTGKVWDIYIPALFYILQFGIMHAYQFYKESQANLILENELRTAALKSELSAIKAQLNPHFLYNTFNAISASLPPGQEKTRNLIATLSDLFRYQLKASHSELVPLKDELEFVEKYLNLEKERFQERLEYKIEVDHNLLISMIPPMILQPIVENAVKHGLSPLITGGTILIRITKRDKQLHFEVVDNGKGVLDIKNIAETGIGIKNTRLRLEKMYNTGLDIHQNIPQGLIVSFTL